MHLVPLHFDLEPPLREGKILEWLRPVHVASDKLATDPYPCSKDVRLLAEIVHLARGDIGRAICLELDSLLGDLLLDLFATFHRDELHLHIGSDVFQLRADGPQFPVLRLRLSGVTHAPVVMFPPHTDSHWRQHSRHGVVAWLAAQVVIYDGPAGAGPAVVELPYQCAAAVPIVAPLLSPAAVAEHQRLTLDQLREVDISREVGVGSHVLHKVRSNAALVAVGFVVEVDDVRLWVEVLWVFDVGLDSGQVRECFHAKLGVEAAAEGVEDLVFLLCAMPHVPLVHVADGWVRADFAVAPRRARMVGNRGDFGCSNVRQNALIDVAGRKVGFEPIVFILVFVVVGEALGFLDLVVFVVACEYDYGGMVPYAPDLGMRLCFDGFEDLGEGWVVAAAEHEVLPYHDAKLIAGVVECCVFVDTATPDSAAGLATHFKLVNESTYLIIFWFAGTISSIHALYFSGVMLVRKLSVGIQHCLALVSV